MDQIQDGTGRGYLVGVDAENRLRVHGVHQIEPVQVAEDHGKTYSVGTYVNTFNSTNPHMALWLRNDSPTHLMYIHQFVYSWNGGDTSHNRCMMTSVYKNPGVPSANHTALVAGNLNWQSSLVLDGTAYKWDASATDGMAYTGGIKIFENWLPQGFTMIDTGGIPVLGQGDAIAIVLTPEEVGKFGCNFNFFMKEVE
jgi:hypothetical protein